MNPSIKRLLGAILLIGALGVSSIMAVRAGAAESHLQSNIGISQVVQFSGEHLHG